MQGPGSTSATLAPHPQQVGVRRGAAFRDFFRIETDPLRLSLFFLMIVTVSRIHQHWKPVARLRPALVLAVLTAVYAFLNPRFV